MSKHTIPALEEIVGVLAEAIAIRVAARLASNQQGEQNPKAGEPEFFSETEVSRRTGLSRRTLQGWRATGRGPKYVKTGRRILYPAFELREFLCARAALNGGIARGERETFHSSTECVPARR